MLPRKRRKRRINMRYLKLFESNDKFKEIEDKLQEIIDSNNIDIDIDYIRDISASATDIFSGNRIKYDKYIDIGEETAAGFESWQLVGDERGGVDDYNELLNFYKLLFSTRQPCYLTFVLNIVFEKSISLTNNPDIYLLKEELKDIRSKCGGENILYYDSISTDKSLTTNSISLTFRKRLNITSGFDDRVLISPSLITDFNTFISTHNISRDVQSDLIKLIVKAQEI
jgi:predicted DNA-binding protein YlxM (UPF0122 family)